MDSDFPDWYRTAAIEPKDEQLRKRWNGVEALRGKLDVNAAIDLVRVFQGIPVRGEVIDVIEGALQKEDASFSARGSEHELRVLSGATVASLLDGTKSSDQADAAALCLLTTTFAPAGRPPIVPAVVERATAYLMLRRQNMRQPIARYSGGVAKGEQKLKQAKEKASKNEILPALSDLIDLTSTVLPKLSEQVAALTNQQRLFREESNVLWWLIGGYSRDFDLPRDQMETASACLVAAKELFDLTESPAGPLAANAFLARALSQTKSPAQSVTLSMAVNGLDNQWVSKITLLSSSSIIDVCPVARAASERLRANGAKDWIGNYKRLEASISPTAKISATILAVQFYEELLLMRLAAEDDA